jgi:hypothetical protein
MTNDEARGSDPSTGSVRWIRVEDELPLAGLEVLVTADGWMRIAYHSVIYGWIVAGVGRLDTANPPTHWMPLPWHLPLP